MKQYSNDQFSKLIRYYTTNMFRKVGFGHLGPSLSIVEVLSVLFNDVMDFSLENYKETSRDWFVLSKGHGGPAYYATLMLKGFFEEEVLYTLNQNGTTLPSHPDRNLIHGVDATTGSLGQGLSQAVGIAKGLKIQNLDGKVYAIIGDGEFNEGQIFEALTFAASQKLDNLVVFIDDNKKQLDGPTEEISVRYDFEKILSGIGFDVKTVDGKDETAIKEGILSFDEHNQRPKCIVLDTIKAQGITYFEEMDDNHHIRFSDQDLEALDAFLDVCRKELDVK